MTTTALAVTGGGPVTAMSQNTLTARMQLARFFAAPAVYLKPTRPPTMHESGTPRWVSEDVMASRSMLMHTPHMYDLYFLRTLSRSERVSALLSTAQCTLAQAALDELKYRYSGITNAAAERTVGAYVYNGAGTIDALFNDLYRMLLGRRAIISNMRSTFRAHALLHGIRSTPQFNDLREQVHGDTANAAVAAALLLEELFSSATQATTEYMAEGIASPEQAQNDTLPNDENGTPQGHDKDAPQLPPDAMDCANSCCDRVNSKLEALVATNTSPEISVPAPKRRGKKKTLPPLTQDMLQQQGDDEEDTDDANNNGGDSDSEDDTEQPGGGQGSGHVECEHDPAHIPDMLAVVDSYLTLANNVSYVRDPAYTSCDRLRGNVTRLFDAFGRVHPLVGAAVTMSKYGDGDSMEVVLGSEPQNMLPCEALLLSMPEFETLFYMKMAEHQLLQYSRRGPEEAGGGTVVIALDVSGSMKDPATAFCTKGQDIRLIDVAGAFAYSLASYAMAWGRGVAIVPFNDGIVSSQMIVLNTDMQRRQRFSRESLLRACTLSPAGGTSFTNTFRAMPGVFAALQGDAENADIVFVTDGECQYETFKDTWSARLPEGHRTFALCIAKDEANARMNKPHADKWFMYSSACTPDTLSQGIEELFDKIVRSSFYKPMSDDAV